MTIAWSGLIKAKLQTERGQDFLWHKTPHVVRLDPRSRCYVFHYIGLVDLETFKQQFKLRRLPDDIRRLAVVGALGLPSVLTWSHPSILSDAILNASSVGSDIHPNR